GISPRRPRRRGCGRLRRFIIWIGCEDKGRLGCAKARPYNLGEGTMWRKSLLALLLLFAVSGATKAQSARWTEKEAADWYAKQAWLVGSNYIPADAINELEMWQADTFDAKRIDLELGWAEAIGLNTMRVFL